MYYSEINTVAEMTNEIGVIDSLEHSRCIFDCEFKQQPSDFTVN